nr:MAG TPA: hypothetical protein [Caudoviricetes sp.]
MLFLNLESILELFSVKYCLWYLQLFFFKNHIANIHVS